MNSMTCLVTGGCGFIGSHVVERLLADGHSVRVVDNFSTGLRKNLANVVNHPKLEVYEADVTNRSTLEPFLREVDWCFHLAALADIIPSIEKPLDYFRVNVEGTVYIVEAARLAHVKRFIYAASSSCYGIPDIFPTDENAELRPQYPYALTKYLGEQIVLHWHRVYKLPVISLRLFNVYGPRARTSGTYGAVLGVFLAQKLAGKPFTVVGDGTQTRDFTFVTDVADAFVKAAASKVSGEIMNVGSGNTYSVNQLAKLLEGPVVHLTRRPGEPDRTFADISKIKRLLHWSPKVNFEDGVRIALDHIEDWRDAPVWNEVSIAEATKSWFHHLSQVAS